MFTVPKLMPFTCGCAAGVVAPAAMKTLVGVTVSFELSLLASVTVTPPDGAGVPNVTGNGADWFGPTVRFAGRLMLPGLTTIAVAVTSATNGSALAWIFVVPGATPVTGTWFMAWELPSGKKNTVN